MNKGLVYFLSFEENNIGWTLQNSNLHWWITK